MKTVNRNTYSNKRIFLLFLFFAIAFLARFFMLDGVPDGLNQDEAYAAYEAFSILHFGRDSWGYAFPVYLTTWGSGMSIMNTYLMIPFLGIMGPTTLAARLPQALLGLFTVFTFYKLFKIMIPGDDSIPLIALFILAINPWHILMCRWALDCNMASAFCLFGFYFFVKGVNESRYYILSSLFYGFTLYCYALSWLLVPCFLLFQVIYLIISRKLKWSKQLVISSMILVVISIPLILFVLVNSGRVNEIVTSFFSVPRMPVYRASEINLDGKKAKLLFFIRSLILQNDGLEWNYAGKFGLYYIWGLPFALVGFLSLVAKLFKSLFKREYHADAMFIIPVMVCIAFSCVIDTNFSKMTLIHLPIISMIVIGIYRIMALFRRESYKRIYLFSILGIGFLSLILLERFYFTDYREMTATNYMTGLKDCLKYTDGISDGRTVYINDYVSHPCVLFYEQIPVTDPNLTESRSSGISADHISNYVFDISKSSEGDLCIIKSVNLPEWYSDDNLLYASGRYMVVRR